ADAAAESGGWCCPSRVRKRVGSSAASSGGVSAAPARLCPPRTAPGRASTAYSEACPESFSVDAMSSRRYQIGQLRIATVSPLRKRTYASSSLLSNAAGWKVPSSKLAALTSSPRLKPGDSNPSPGRASCFIGPRLPGRLRGRSYRPSAGVLPLRQPGGEDVTCGVDVPVMGRAAGALPGTDVQRHLLLQGAACR